MEFERFIKIGQEIGLEGEDLMAFVSEREEKEARTTELAERKEREAFERKEKERIDDLEREERQRRREHERIMKELEVKQEQAKQPELPSKVSENKAYKPSPKLPKLPAFRDGKDEIDSYLLRFERYATAMNWPNSEWATSLSALLTGRSLDVYARLPADKAKVYNDLKAALLFSFQLTEEGFRVKFRSARPETGETYTQFSDRIKSYLMRWVEVGQIPKTFDGIVGLLLKEQVHRVCSKELVLYLKERQPKDIAELVKLADTYVEAHRYRLDKKPANVNRNVSFRPNQSPGQFSSQQQSQKSSPTAGNRFGKPPSTDPRSCYGCGKTGHLARDCPRRPRTNLSTSNKTLASFVTESLEETPEDGVPEDVNPVQTVASCMTVPAGSTSKLCDCPTPNPGEELMLGCGHIVPFIGAAWTGNTNMPVKEGYLGNHKVSVLRDTGCSTVVVKRDLVDDTQLTGRSQNCIFLDQRTVKNCPMAEIWLDTPYFSGRVEAVCLDNPLYDVTVGNIAGARNSADPDPTWKLNPAVSHKTTEMTSAVQTRSQKQRSERQLKPLKTAHVGTQGVPASKDQLLQAQRADGTLKNLWSQAHTGEFKINSRENKTAYLTKNGLLYREHCNPRINQGKKFKQLVVPQPYRNYVMKVAHDSPMAGHMGTRRTTDRVTSKFYWPGVNADTQRYCVSCDVCQRTVSKGSIARAPLGEMPLIDTPFRRVAVDLIGPIAPMTERGNRYILTLVDYCTRYPEAIALRSIETVRVAEALLEIFSRLGVPDEILTDMGTQFTSDLMKEVGRLLMIKQLTTTPYHPMCNGLCERYNGTLKKMLRRMCSERPKDWDRYIPALLFAYREVPQESLGFSPFEMMYGRTMRGPMTILRDLWTGETAGEEVRSSYQYVLDLRERMESTCEMAKEELKRASKRYRKYYDTRSRDRKFNVDDEVLILLPTDNNKLLTQWQGPYKVTGKVAKNDYKILIKGKDKTFHTNLLKKYIRRDDEDDKDRHANTPPSELAVVCTGVIYAQDPDVHEEPILELPPLEQKETVSDVNMCPDISEFQTHDVTTILEQYTDVFTDLPGKTLLVEHTVKLTTSTPTRSKPYPVPLAVQDTIKKEVATMIQLGVIEESTSPYASPIVLVRKKDGSNRFCIDYRKLNQITIFDPEPIPNFDDLMAKLTEGKYFTKIDLSKGYWQIPIYSQDKEKTAFVTANGLFQFKVLPFGMVNAPAVFSRMMRKLLKGMSNVVNFIDDVCIYTDSWDKHIQILVEVLDRLRSAGLTARPTKCFVGFDNIEFLGHIVGGGNLRPQPGKVEGIMSAKPPTTKKEVRSFLGFIGYYRRFIPNFAAIASPLTDLTRGKQPKHIVWDKAQERAFVTLKSRMASAPVLHLPDTTKPFIVRTDASDTGMGAVLMQSDGSETFPIGFASKKLLPRQKAYSVIERECLALVWAVEKFKMYLYGKEFIIETDHRPLTYIAQARYTNNRVMRWSLALQPYRYVVRAIKGVNNNGADFLSRCHVE